MFVLITKMFMGVVDVVHSTTTGFFCNSIVSPARANVKIWKHDDDDGDGGSLMQLVL
jgi:hypothetical protein